MKIFNKNDDTDKKKNLWKYTIGEVIQCTAYLWKINAEIFEPNKKSWVQVWWHATTVGGTSTNILLLFKHIFN